MNSLFISVIIPVYNDVKSLEKCLQALENQSLSKSSYEVIVVDNASEECIKSVVAPFDQAIVAFESKPGSYAARNKGISIAKGNVIAFTDADCIPAKNWLDKGISYLLSVPNCGLVAGRVEFCFQNSDKPTAIELCDSVMHLQQETYLEKFNYGVTANIFTFRDVFGKVGLFNDELKSGGDHEWGQRVFSAGYRQLYARDAYVVHPARYLYKDLYKKILRTTTTEGSYNLIRARNYTFREHIKSWVRNLMPPLKKIAKVNIDNRQLKFKFFLTLVSLKYIILFEKLKLKLK